MEETRIGLLGPDLLHALPSSGHSMTFLPQPAHASFRDFRAMARPTLCLGQSWPLKVPTPARPWQVLSL